MWPGQGAVPLSGSNLHTLKRGEPGEHSARGMQIWTGKDPRPFNANPTRTATFPGGSSLG